MFYQRFGKKGFTLIELLVVVAIIALLIAILLPSLGRAREASKRGMCATNIKGIVGACKTYAMDNKDQWPTVGSSRGMAATGTSAVLPLKCMGGVTALARNEDSRSVPFSDPNQSKYSNVFPSRALWVLVRGGQSGAKNFICPSSEDTADDTPDVQTYYDFRGYGYLSYGYQMPFYTSLNSCVARENMDQRMVLLGDKGPQFYANAAAPAVLSVPPPTNPPTVIGYNSMYYLVGAGPSLAMGNLPPGGGNGVIYADQWGANLATDLSLLKPLNSPNHAKGEGQNIARVDGSAEFVKTPCAGIDRDNIYTLMRPSYAGLALPGTIWSGYYPGASSQNYGCPGVMAGNASFNTDTVLVP